MLIKALCDYYDMIKSDNTTDVIPQGYSSVKVHYEILLSPDGEIKDIIDKRIKRIEKDKKGKEKTFFDPITAILPERTQKTSIDSNIIEHRPLYIFGLNYEKDKLSPYDKTSKALKSNTMFKDVNSLFFKDLNSEICMAYYNFITTWCPEKQTDNKLLINLDKDYTMSSYVFGLDGNPAVMLHNDECFKKAYDDYLNNKKSENDVSGTDSSMCSISGQVLPTARIHDKIKGLAGGNSVGCVLVGMKESAFESYGKSQSFNSSISEVAMKKYTNTLNMLLESKSHHKVFDDFTLVYFALKKNDEKECDLLDIGLSGTSDNYDTEKDLQSIYNNAKRGIGANRNNFNVDENVTFCLAGLAPNSSRISQKFFYKDKFGSIISNVIQHQNDLKLSENNRQISLNSIKKELVLPKSKDEKVPPPLISSILQSILTGQNYPDQLLSTVIRRVKTDSNDDKNSYIKMNDTRIGIIKACLNRKQRNKNLEEEIKMSLDLGNKNQAYLCGRLFAVLEKIQQDSVDGTLNKTIKDTYFSSACSKPATVFPSLVSLAQNHLKKLSSPNFYNCLIGEIIDGLEGEFPSVLSNDEQGKFIIGYYQQNKNLYTKKDERK